MELESYMHCDINTASSRNLFVMLKRAICYASFTVRNGTVILEREVMSGSTDCIDNCNQRKVNLILFSS